MRTFQLLSDLPRTYITQCQQMLPNSCQCPKPGFVLVTETVHDKATQYQLCRGHASLLKQQDDAEKAAAGEPVPTPIATPLQLKNDAPPPEKEPVKAPPIPSKNEAPIPASVPVTEKN